MYKSKKSQIAAIISYLFLWIGVVVAILLRDRDDELSWFHVRQAMILAVGETIATALIRLRGVFAVVGNIADVALLILALMGICRAAKGSAEPLPLIDKLNIL